jgi:hypothetical protein
MLGTNPFASIALLLPPLAMKIYVLLMIAAVVVGTLFDITHKGSARFFAQRREKSRASARTAIGGAALLALGASTVAEAAVSGEFCKWPRRASHLLMMYGFLLHIVTTVVMVFGYPADAAAPAVLPTLWTIGALMVVVGGVWFFFFLRVNVAYDGASPFHLGRADLFVGSLIVATLFALLWHYVQTVYGNGTGALTLFALYIFFTTLLFVSVPWSKFGHMFFKPAVAFQRRVEEANGSTDLPSPTTENFIVRS